MYITDFTNVFVDARFENHYSKFWPLAYIQILSSYKQKKHITVLYKVKQLDHRSS